MLTCLESLRFENAARRDLKPDERRVGKGGGASPLGDAGSVLPTETKLLISIARTDRAGVDSRPAIAQYPARDVDHLTSAARVHYEVP